MPDLPHRSPDLDPLASWIQHLSQIPGRLENQTDPTPDELIHEAIPTASVPYGSVIHPDAPLPLRLHFGAEGAVDRVNRLTAIWERSERARAEAAAAAPTPLSAGNLAAQQTIEAATTEEAQDTERSLFDTFVRYLAAATSQDQRNEIFQSLLTDLQRAGLLAEANAAAPDQDPEVQLLEDVLAGLRRL